MPKRHLQVYAGLRGPKSASRFQHARFPDSARSAWPAQIDATFLLRRVIAPAPASRKAADGAGGKLESGTGLGQRRRCSEIVVLGHVGLDCGQKAALIRDSEPAGKIGQTKVPSSGDDAVAI